jgi:hypothetical protein
LREEDVEKIRNIVVNVIRLINCRRGRKYISCSLLAYYFTPKEFVKNIPNIDEKLKEAGMLNLKELCWIFRVVVFKFIRSNSVPAVLTSWRIRPIGKGTHLAKRRNV